MLYNKNIFKKEVLKSIATCLIIVISQNTLAASEPLSNQTDSWQMKQIYQPSQHLLERENRGFVNIYDGFTDTQVVEILDKKFERIENMMFTRVRKTDIQGQVLKDPVSGQEVVEDDGCD